MGYYTGEAKRCQERKLPGGRLRKIGSLREEKDFLAEWTIISVTYSITYSHTPNESNLDFLKKSLSTCNGTSIVF